MQTKEFAITLDMVQALPFRPFEVVEGDTGNLLRMTLLNSGEPLLLNDCWVCVAYTSSMGFAFQDADSGIVIGEEAGTLSLLMDPQCYGPGNVSVDVQIYSGPNKKVLITSKRFDFRCVRSLMSEGIIRANMAYPPLLAAAQEALDAAEAARKAVANMEGLMGEMNVQADWNETDILADGFIRNKPYVPQNPEDVDAAPAMHANRHAAAGEDPVTPLSIGAEPRRLQFTDVSVAVSAFVADETYTDYPYRATVTLSGVTAAMTPEVIFGCADAAGGNFAPVADCYAGGVYLYAAEAPGAAMTIPTIICWK